MSDMMAIFTNPAKYNAYVKKYGPYEIEGQMSIMDVDWDAIQAKEKPAEPEIEDFPF